MVRMSRQVPKDVREKISESLKGRKLSTETRKKMSEAQKAAWAKVPSGIDAMIEIMDNTYQGEKLECENRPITVAEDFVTKALISNTSIFDAFNEIVDNIIDAKLKGKDVTAVIDQNFKDNILSICDDGSGISDITKLSILGGSEKVNMEGKIGKYGAGLFSALGRIAVDLAVDKSKDVNVIIRTAHKGTMSTAHITFEGPNRIFKFKGILRTKCDEKEHFTNISINNVSLENIKQDDKRKKVGISALIDSLEETYQNTFDKGLKIIFGKRVLGTTKERALPKDSRIINVKVGDFDTQVRIFHYEEKVRGAHRNFDDTAIRLVDANSGRLLYKSKDLWSKFIGRGAQQCICGIRVEISVPSTIEGYQLFGVNNTKNGVIDIDYKDISEFAKLKEYLYDAYLSAFNAKKEEAEGTFELDGDMFTVRTKKMTVPFFKVANHEYIISTKPGVEYLARAAKLTEKHEQKTLKAQPVTV